MLFPVKKIPDSRAFSTNGNFSKDETEENTHPFSLGMIFNRRGWARLSGVMQIICPTPRQNLINWKIQLPAVPVAVLSPVKIPRVFHV